MTLMVVHVATLAVQVVMLALMIMVRRQIAVEIDHMEERRADLIRLIERLEALTPGGRRTPPAPWGPRPPASTASRAP
jgi:hypothetical protein